MFPEAGYGPQKTTEAWLTVRLRRGETLQRGIRCIRLGLTTYTQALQMQRRWHAWCVDRWTNALLLTQHQPVNHPRLPPAV